jgi:hypothetical protein
MCAYGPCGSLAGTQWIAKGFRPRDDKVGSDGSVRFGYNTILSLRGESGARDVAIHRVPGEADDLSPRVLVHSGSPRASPSRRQGSGVRRWTVGGLLACCHCEERAERETWQSTACNGGGRLVYSLTGSQWIATGFALAMTRWEVMGVCGERLEDYSYLVIARKERSEGRGNPLHAMNANG